MIVLRRLPLGFFLYDYPTIRSSKVDHELFLTPESIDIDALLRELESAGLDALPDDDGEIEVQGSAGFHIYISDDGSAICFYAAFNFRTTVSLHERLHCIALINDEVFGLKAHASTDLLTLDHEMLIRGGVSYPNFGYVAARFQENLVEALNLYTQGLIDWEPGPDAADFLERCHSAE